MRIGVTTLFRGSAFGGAQAQVALYMALALKDAGHNVEFLISEESDDWFTDCADLASRIPILKIKNGIHILNFNLIIEIGWFLPAELRKKISQRSVMFYHYPPVFYDIESSTYPLSGLPRDFNGIDALWTWSHFEKTDYEYLEFLSGCPVIKLPLLWNPVLIDSYKKEASVPDWTISEDLKITIAESNESNTSSCTIPLTILSEICKSAPTTKWRVLNSDVLFTRPFFLTNVVNNLHFKGDISGNFTKRVRIPDLCRESTVILAHQRWRPIKYMLLDALYLGIPLIHNCELLREVPGGQWFYTMNRIGQALDRWSEIRSAPRPSLETVRSALLSRWGPVPFSKNLESILLDTIHSTRPQKPVRVPLRIAFYDMWADFQVNHNAFVGALTAIGCSFEVNQSDPSLIIFGPFGSENQKAQFKYVKKIFFTGENAPPVIRDDVILNVGFRRDITENYLRLPNWMTELNWFNQDPALIVNPVPFPLDTLKPSSIKSREKFCAFVASNPNSIERNSLYHIISRYKNIDSAGSVFPTMEKLPCGPGGAHGQAAKIEFYKQYKFVLASENASSPGYVTEKLLHAKMAGCVPIYWGDPLVHLEFEAGSYVNVADFPNQDALLRRIKELDQDEDAWLAIARKPLMGDEKLSSCRKIWATLVEVMLDAVPRVAKPAPTMSLPPYKTEILGAVGGRAIVTCCNSKFVPSAIRLLKSCSDPIYVWVWGVTDAEKAELERAGAKRVINLDTTWSPGWPEFWDPDTYAWKALVIYLGSNVFEKGTQVLYLDSGIEIVNSLEHVWKTIESEEIFVLNMPEHKMKTWCSPRFCELLSVTEMEKEQPQYSANIIGYKVGGQYNALFTDAFMLACRKEVIVGHKWHAYSDVCKGHRHDQSIYSLIGIRAGLRPRLLDEYAGHSSRDETQLSGRAFYVHRGNWVQGGVRLGRINETLVVNLAHREDRLAKFRMNHPTLSHTIQKAVYGRDIRLTPAIAHLFRNNDFKWKKSVMGCALSHYEIWKRIAGRCDDSIHLILEDDVHFEPGFAASWNRICDSMPVDADFIFLGGVLPPNKPALPFVTEPVNPFFARVKKHNLFGGVSRRYFHFCTYAYVITCAGAKKLCDLIADKGIFTSMDHMIVNHGDELLNLYFTTPLLAGCIQDADPAYQNADFNNFNRVDKFDSEIWNNLDAFTEDDIVAVTKELTVVYFKDDQPQFCVEAEWLSELFGRSLRWVDKSSVIESGEPILVYYQHVTPTQEIEGWINRHMDCRLYLLHLSDESCLTDVSLYTHPGIRAVFRNYWRPDLASSRVIHLPLGYHSGRGGSCDAPMREREFDWSFAGAMDRPERSEILDMMKKEIPKCRIHKTPTWNSAQNLAADAYGALLSKSKFIPCFKGSMNVESFRFYEALEHGCIPLIQLDKTETYKNLLGADAIILGLADMKAASHVMTSLSSRPEIMDKLQKDMRTWWVGYKRSLTAQLQKILFPTKVSA
jgi:GR25 family glycosyltransferase involved in LPS biosynthesis